ncbi:MAG: LysM peptidoglycan-binding domain-containing protein [Thermodesulfobacteriota bacterium]|nr:LysM peptidoglycan-binding domain-containing protein [Thermodesulfobacteriota bacterium]
MKKTILFMSLFFGISCILLFHTQKAIARKDHLALSLTKTIYVKKYKDKKIYYEPYTIKKGEWLWKVFRDKYKIPPERISRTLSALKSLNPDITNTDLVHPGQKILFPLIEETEKPLITPSSLPPSFTFEEYTVKKGQTLSTILNKDYNISRSQIYNQYLKLICDLNTDITDPNLIYANQKVYIPVHKTTTKKERKLAKKKVKKSLITKKINNKNGPTAFEGAKWEEGSIKAGIRMPIIAEYNPNTFKDTIGKFFKDIGGDYINKGNYYIPIAGGGELTLDTAAFPVVEMKSGKKVILDYNDELPARMEELIESNWEKYKVINVKGEDAIESILYKVVPQLGPYSMKKGDIPIELKEKIITKIWTDWVITEQQSSPQKDRIFAVNILRKGKKGTPPAVKDYIESRGVSIIDLSFTEDNKLSGNQKKGSIPRFEKEVDFLDSSTNKDLISGLLSLINQPFSKDVQIPLQKADSKSFKMGVTVDISMEKGDDTYLISLKDLSDNLIKILDEKGFKVLNIKSNEASETVITQVLHFLGFQFSFSVFEFDTAKKGDSQNIKFIIPGFLIDYNDSSRILLTHATLDKNLNYFLHEKRIKVIRYQ